MKVKDAYHLAMFGAWLMAYLVAMTHGSVAAAIVFAALTWAGREQ